jgi:ribosomal protein S12 methylthiotransferase accessory factor YcaO
MGLRCAQVGLYLASFERNLPLLSRDFGTNVVGLSSRSQLEAASLQTLLEGMARLSYRLLFTTMRASTDKRRCANLV